MRMVRDLINYVLKNEMIKLIDFREVGKGGPLQYTPFGLADPCFIPFCFVFIRSRNI